MVVSKKENNTSEENIMASEGDRIFVGKIVVGTDPNEELTKNDWAIVVGKSLSKKLYEKNYKVHFVTREKDSHGIIIASGSSADILSRFDGEIVKEAVYLFSRGKC